MKGSGMNELSKRAVACKGWRWMRGMVDTTGRTYVGPAVSEAAWVWVVDEGFEWLPVEGRLPDLTDPATKGCLLALVREAYQCPWLSVVGSAEDGWRIDAEMWGRGLRRSLASQRFGLEAEALIAALEVAE